VKSLVNPEVRLGLTAKMVEGQREILQQLSRAFESESAYAEFKALFHLYADSIERVLYSVLENIFESQEEVLEAYGRHQVVRERIKLIDLLSPASSEWQTAIGELQDCYRRNVEDEQFILFPKLQIVFDPRALEVLAEQFHEVRSNPQR
jgi:hypothetical protein